ncbi:MAG: lamin tail domain-containing protein, partial [Parabacteroides sp.]|nr:lamin tail domain-containing protein [Parabacteroides sp.]
GWHLSTDPRGGTPGESNSEPTTTEEEPEEEPDEPETPVVPEEPEQPEESYPKGSVIIHEVMADPKGLTALPETEYIELYNKVDQSIDLSNWILNYGTTPIALTGIVIPAHGWAVLYRSGREIEVGNGQACPLDKFPSALANTGKELSLYDANGQLMDQYTYPKAKPACSWEFDEEGWHLSSDPRGGTPGEANSEAEENEEDPDETPDEPEEETNPEPEIPEAQQPQPGDIIINELLPEPFVDGSEYIELYNRSEQELSLKDVCISTRKSDGSLNTRYPLEAYPQTLQAGDYLLLTKSIEGVENFYSLPASQNWLECKLPVLSNTGSTVVLYRGEGEIIIDEVSYSPKWHAPTVKNKKGVALERKDPDKDSQNADNWTSAASSAGFGTPGLENSQYLNGETESDSEEIDDPIYQPTGTFQIPYRLNQSGYMARGWIFDLSGRKVALIADNTSLGTQGYLEWNGKGRDGSPVNTGIYIIYLELWHPGGNVIRKKQVLLIP